MSTYGTAVVVDSPAEAELNILAAELAEDPDADVYRSNSPDGWARMVVWWNGIEQRPVVDRVLGRLDRGRSVIAADYDEFGAAWTVLGAEAGTVRVVHRRYVLNADPTDPAGVQLAIEALEQGDPRTEDVAGEMAAEAAAELFGVEADQMRAAEEKAATTELVTGGVGDPFPWWSALRLPWPGSDLGEPLAPRQPERLTVAKLTRTAWRAWATESINPLLRRPTHWVGHAVEWTAKPYGSIGSPVGWLAQGLYRQPASSGEYFLCHVIVLPLYVPIERLSWSCSLTLSSEAHGRAFRNPTEETRDAVARDLARAVNDSGVPFLERVGDLDGFRANRHQHQQRVLEDTGVFWHAEEVGYTDILLGDFASAEAQLLRQSQPDEEEDRHWETKSRQRCAHMLDLLRQDSATAEAQLAQWAADSASAALKLKWRGPR